MVPVTGAPVILGGAFQEGISPEPEDPMPIAVFVFNQEKEAPIGLVTKGGTTISSPGQTVSTEMGLKTGVGLMVMLKLMSGPGQLLSKGETVIVPSIGNPVLLGGAFHGGMLPEPEVLKPIAVLELTHEKDAPEGMLEKVGILI
jgi:hypothetical protein